MVSGDGAVIGRTHELAVLEGALADAARGRSGFVLVSGEAGIGKTTLVSALARRAATEDAALRVVVSRAWDGKGAPALHLWAEALRPLDVTLALPPSVADEEARFAAIEKVVAAVRAASAARALLVVLDDLQWADVPSLLALRLLVRSLRDERVLVVATVRTPHESSPESNDLLLELRREATVLSVSGLAEEDLAALARSRGIDAPSAGSVLRRATAGNPLYAVEMLLDEDARSAVRDGRAPSTPAPLAMILARHFARLEGEHREIVACGALGSEPMEVALVAAAAGSSVETAALALEAGARHGVLVREADGRHRFSHELLRTAARDSIAPARALERHLAWAQVLSTRGDDHLADVVHHAFAADPTGTSEDAANAAVAAARSAMKRLCYEDAAALLVRAATAHERAGRSAPLAAALTRLAEARHATGDVQGSTTTAERALGVARGVGDPVLVARAALALGQRQKIAQSDARLAAVLEESLAALDASSARGGGELRGANDVRCAVEARLACALQPELDPRRAVELARHAVDRARATGDVELTARVLHTARPAFRILEDLDERVAMDRELLDLAGRLGDEVLAVHAHRRLLHEAVEAGDRQLADLHLADYERLAGEVRLADHTLGAASARIMRSAICGDMDGARAAIADLEATRGEWAPRLGARWPVDPVRSLEMGLAAALDEPASYDALLERAPRAAIPALVAHSFAAFFAARAGKLDAARAAYDAVARPVLDGSPSFLFYVQLAETCIALDDRAHAGRFYDALRDFAGRHVVWTPFWVYDGSVDRLLGGLAATVGDHERALGHFERAIRAEVLLGALPFAERTRRQRDAVIARQARSSSRPQAPLRAPLAARSFDAVSPHLAQEGETWLVTFGSETARLKDADGLHYLAFLLARPNAPITARELFMARAGTSAHEALPSSDAGEHLDAQAIASYRDRLRELRKILDDAASKSDLGLVEASRREMGFLESELSRAVGLGGRPRRAASDAERTRVNVTTRIRKVIEKLREHAPSAADHLARSVRTGTTCAYVPPLPS